ncbi:hypothetical protein EGT51_10640 [Levilactobacillus suantsaiihabitans]|uniref:Uncharacterized protein n=1 Tax=Levilactobacillus suantsaiihabitans TaxID=2487722 RepID=A0A4Z0J7L4_9LACO|nr:hypothetical protein EGT51_10640 [Levilactobacillus suantsaiihabitans]
MVGLLFCKTAHESLPFAKSINQKRTKISATHDGCGTDLSLFTALKVERRKLVETTVSRRFMASKIVVYSHRIRTRRLPLINTVLPGFINFRCQNTIITATNFP